MNKIEANSIDTNLPNGWAWTTLENSCQKITDGSHYTPKYVSDGYPFITISNVNNDNIIDFSTAKFITKSDFEKLKINCNPLKGDILFSKDGTVGKENIDFEWITIYLQFFKITF